jgi:hypothetical protein
MGLPTPISLGFDAWGAYISGYRDAGRSLTSAVPSAALLPEWAFYPIAFLYRHCLELQVKSTILNTQQLLNEAPSAPGGHDLGKLWNTARVLLSQAGFELENEQFVRVDRTIHELSQVDPSGQSFRYPLDRKGLPTLPTVRDVNIRDFSTHMDDLVDALFRLNADVHLALNQAQEEEEEAS